MSIPNLVFLSHPTYLGSSGATAAATFAFFTKGYKPPVQARAIDMDVVVNQNGKFKYLYDNGPGFKSWQPFSIACESIFATVVGAIAATQYARITEMWQYPGVLGMRTPDGTYAVHWAANSLEPAFRTFPTKTTDIAEWEVVVQFEEAT